MNTDKYKALQEIGDSTARCLTDYEGFVVSSEDLLTYCNCFYFGE